MKTTSQFDAIASQCDRLANVVTDLKRYLGDFAENTSVAASVLETRSIVHLRAPSVREGGLRNSQWHKIVNRLSDLYGPGLVTRERMVVCSSHQTPFAIEVRAEVYHYDTPTSASTTLEAVLA